MENHHMRAKPERVTELNTERIDARPLLKVLLDFRRGDFTNRLPAERTGLTGKIYEALNEVIDINERMVKEFDRVANVVGKEGRIRQRASLSFATGSWAVCIDSINTLIADLVQPTTEVARVIGAVAKGDLSQTMTLEIEGRPLTGEFLRTAKIVNTMVDQLSTFASEVTRVAREVGTEGKLGGQAEVKGVAGTWKDLTDNVNSMANNLTNQVRNIAEVTTAVAKGDLSKKITVDVKGEILELKNTINTMVDQLSTFASEVTRVAREVGTEGKLGGQAEVRGVAGTWKDLTDNVNSMASNLTSQVRNIAAVTTAVANGDLSKKITVDVKGEILELKNTINTMVDQLSSFASEVTRVAREVGTEGKLGGQAEVRGVAGTWKDLTDNVNSMASNLTSQVRNIAAVTTAVANGDLTKKITVDVRGEILELKNTINTMVDQLTSFASEVTRVAREVGTEGKLGGQAQVRGVAGTWKDLTDNVNFMANNLTNQVRNIAEVTTAVANGDLSKKIAVDVKGEILELKNTINTMVDQLSSFASEVTRVAREVGTEGKLGGQAEVKGVAGTWKDLTDNVNLMASNLTDQVRGIAKVVTAVANGNLKRKLVLEAKGEIEELAETINSMIDTLATFADQVTTVAREVGIEGKLGGQASVPGAAGTWRDLTDNVNRMAAALTTQVRAIAEVATAVTKGDLSRSIAVDAAGEVAALKDNINEMIRNRRETTEKNKSQDWLKTNLAKFTRLLQGQRDLLAVSRLILSELAPLVSVQHGVFYVNEGSEQGESDMKLLASYAYRERKPGADRFKSGEGLVGQCAFEKERILLKDVPADYIHINSGLGEAPPLNIVVLPVLFEGQIKAVIELASFQRFSDIHLTFFDQLTESIGIVLNTITATMRTEELLKQSQTLAAELQTRQAELTETNRRLQEQAKTLKQSEERLRQQQDELQQTNEELEEKANLLAKQNLEVERKNQEIERAAVALQEKAEQLAITSKYKSEFLANMSHELRTPLNSMLILAKLMAEGEENLTEKQREFARTIYSSGSDLLDLINEILDLTKIESGMMEVEVGHVIFQDLADYVERTFRQVAHDKGLEFSTYVDPKLVPGIHTDQRRLQQVLKNLLSNAFKFTERGRVSLRIMAAESGWNPENRILSKAESVIAFSVKDTGIGIPIDKRNIIFEPFQQADGTITRKFGGTGLGLSISREIATLLGGEIQLDSVAGNGSTFTLYLPVSYTPETKKRPALVNVSVQAMVSVPKEIEVDAFATENVVDDDRGRIESGDKILLIIDDDLSFARIMMEIARERGFKVLVATQGDAGLALAREYRPSAITLEIKLPIMNGWIVLDRLKHSRATRHIPVHIISVAEEKQRGLKMGALAFENKPVTPGQLRDALSKIENFVQRAVKSLLVVSNGGTAQQRIIEIIGDADVDIVAVGKAEEAMEELRNKHYDCVLLDLGFPDIKGLDLTERIKSQVGNVPVIVYTGKDLGPKEERELRRLAESIIVKDVRSLDRLLDETVLLLHRVEANLMEPKRQVLERLRKKDPVLAGKKVLIIDDDMRNIFALTSLLERYEIQVLYAENGKDGIETLKSTSDIDVALVDIMMPEMDGYEAMRQIREMSEFRRTPLIALTAKAMKGDREKCIEAGASDYITKPADSDQLLSLLRVFLFK
jgi:HAMP domain-containing protein/signal transduction histidine kinase/CheY-like chemotaxis protein